MTFHIRFYISLDICSETAKPYYCKKNKETGNFEKHYSIPDIIIPEHLRKYIELKGDMFYAYINYFYENEQDVTNVHVEEFECWYPSWEEVIHSEHYDPDNNSWTEEDHLNFKELVDWCVKQDADFHIYWMY